jgi:hypothetical protein
MSGEDRRRVALTHRDGNKVAAFNARNLRQPRWRGGPADHRPKPARCYVLLLSYPHFGLGSKPSMFSKNRNGQSNYGRSEGCRRPHIRTNDTNVRIIGATLTSAPGKPDQRIPWSVYQKRRPEADRLSISAQSLNHGASSAAKVDENLGGTARYPIANDSGAEHLHVSIRRCFRV